MGRATEFIRYAYRIGALELCFMGRKLKSGRISPYFFNSGLFCNGKHLAELAKGYVGAIPQNLTPQVLFGPSYKGSAIAVGVSIAYDTMGQTVGYAYDRKEAKDHGEGGLIIGESLKNKTVGLLDDVMTTGGSLEQAFDIVSREGGIPIFAAIAFDRQEKNGEDVFSAVQVFQTKYKIPVFTAATLDDFITVLGDSGESHESILEEIRKYKSLYGITTC